MFDIEKPINILDFKSQGLQCLILKQIKTINNLYLKSQGLQYLISKQFKIRGLAKLDKSGKLQNSFISCPRLKLTFSCMMELNK